MKLLLATILISFAAVTSPALAKTYNLEIAYNEVNITGTPIKKITINGGIPGPTLILKDGEDVTINVTNRLNENTSIHWHGLLLDPVMDGVPTYNKYPGIEPGETFAYRFKMRQTGTYWYHAFRTSGTFTPATSLNADVLVIAGGGGGGGGNNDGAGGAGGLLAFTSQSLTATSYTCTVGAGGVGAANAHGLTGSDSQFGALTLVKGGGGGGSVGYSGGSGGGNGFDQTGAAGAGTSGQGFAGGPGQNSPPDYYGGGGGGSAEAGNTDGNGHGGDGLSTYSSWGLATSTGQNISGTVYFAGGGSGAGQATSTSRPGGDGGGGRGAGSSGLATAGTVNTGGGGGSGGNSAGNTPGSGGSGLIIVRYTIA